MSIDYVVNKILSLDPDVELYLQDLAHKTINITCPDLPIKNISCAFTDTYLQITVTTPEHIDTYITWSLTKTTVTGDLEVAAAFQKLLFKLHIDWEEELSKYTGDVIAHQTVYILKQLRQYQQQSRSSLETMIIEYLQEESGLLPTKYEIDEFMNAVDILRLDADRVQARIENYESN